MKPQLLALLILAACQSGGGNTTTTQNILHCESYGNIDQSTTETTTNEITEPATDEAIDEVSTEEVPATTSGIQEDSGIGLVPGLKRSWVEASDADLERCESEATCQVLGFNGKLSLVEHCVGISFPEVER